MVCWQSELSQTRKMVMYYLRANRVTVFNYDMSTSILLKPIPGFCIKSSIVQPATYKPLATDNGLEPPVTVPVGRKVFVNIAWDPKVPSPPEGSEAVIQHAMSGGDIDDNNPDGWFVPVVVSPPRLEKDKGR